MSPVTAVTVRVPAKVNLQLAVGPVRARRLPLPWSTVYHAVSLFDEVTVAPAERDSVAVTGEGAGSVPADGGNLAARAADALAYRRSGPAPGMPPDWRSGSASGSRWRLDWPAAAPTPRPPWSPATSCGAPGLSQQELC